MSDDLYQILEIEPEATPDEIRKAYYRLAKLYHPDLQDDEDTEATERFLSIQKAYKVLSEPEDRRSYDKERRGAKPAAALDRNAQEKFAKQWGAKRSTLEEERHARQAYMKAEAMLEAGHVDRAIQLMEAVVRTVPDKPEYQSLYGYALAQNGERLHRARDACRRALEAEPQNADFHAHLGYVYLRAGLKQTAESCFAEALRINPVHPVAQAHRAGEQGASSGLLAGFKRLFKRS